MQNQCSPFLLHYICGAKLLIFFEKKVGRATAILINIHKKTGMLIQPFFSMPVFLFRYLKLIFFIAVCPQIRGPVYEEQRI